MHQTNECKMSHVLWCCSPHKEKISAIAFWEDLFNGWLNLLYSQNTAFKYLSARISFVFSLWFDFQRDYLCDLCTAMSEAADRLRFGGQTLSRFSQFSGVHLRQLRLDLIRQVVQDADAVLCGLQSRYTDKNQIKTSMASCLITYIDPTYWSFSANNNPVRFAFDAEVAKLHADPWQVSR